jgi:hypothetical protein
VDQLARLHPKANKAFKVKKNPPAKKDPHPLPLDLFPSLKKSVLWKFVTLSSSDSLI